MADDPRVLGQPYEVVSVRGVAAPPGTEGSGWHCYVIVQGPNTIRGYKQGNLEAVTREVDEIIDQLNERRVGKRGRVHLIPTPKKRAQ